MDRPISHRDATGFWEIIYELLFLQTGRVAIRAFIDAEAIWNRNVIE